jgi:transcriptional regulator with XRE-family HTH domain
VVLFRRLLGEVLRAHRVEQGRTLRQLSADARVSLGYMSEIERGRKEASSELLAAICGALDVPLSEVLLGVADAVALEEAAMGLRLSKDLGNDLGKALEPTLEPGLKAVDLGSVPREGTQQVPGSGDVVASAA